jgi:hypothetical protein
MLSVVCCQVEVSATSWSLVPRSPTDCGASLYVIKKPRGRGGHSPRWASEPDKIIIIIISYTLFCFPDWRGGIWINVWKQHHCWREGEKNQRSRYHVCTAMFSTTFERMYSCFIYWK